MSNERDPLVDSLNGIGAAEGVRSAIRDAGPLLPLRDAEQLELLNQEAGNGTMQAVHVKMAPRGRGRPQNSRNKATQEVRSYLLKRYAHPLEVLAQVYSRPVDMLAAELGCTKAEAQQMQIRAAAEVAPYVEGKMPHQVELSTKGDFNLLIPGVTIAPDEARQMAEGTFVLGASEDFIEGEFSMVPESENP